eukprot:5961248-Pyramimonas_sp.AAC.1
MAHSVCKGEVSQTLKPLVQVARSLWEDLSSCWTRLEILANCFLWKSCPPEEWALNIVSFLASTRQTLLKSLDQNHSQFLEDQGNAISE